jgi:hypothetical protein
MIVVIPCHDEPDLLTTLQSLLDCEKTDTAPEVIVVINSGEDDDLKALEQNAKTLEEAQAWIEVNSNTKLKFHLIDVKGLPKRHAGVGLARKIGMDEAVQRFDDINNQNGVIVCLDADCTVDANYCSEIEKHFLLNTKASGCSIYFEHPSQGNEFSKENYEGIINYELFLRYYISGLNYSRFPYSFHTIGSCMAVRSDVYQKQGGMNRRKAGEDFYFLHKIFPLGNFTLLNTTRVIPSPRQSHRVPFGTGSAMNKYLDAQGDFYSAYHFQSFIDLKMFLQIIPELYNKTSQPEIPDSIQSFLSDKSFPAKLIEIRSHCASQKMFIKRFYNWFDGFMVLKYMHFARDNFFPSLDIAEAATQLMHLNGIYFHKIISKKDLLMHYRKWEKEQPIPSKPSQYFYQE